MPGVGPELVNLFNRFAISIEPTQVCLFAKLRPKGLPKKSECLVTRDAANKGRMDHVESGHEVNQTWRRVRNIEMRSSNKNTFQETESWSEKT